MDHDQDGDGAINLSTSQRPSACTTPNGDTSISYIQENDQVRKKEKIYNIIAYFFSFFNFLKSSVNRWIDGSK